jgi:hypothetical protein
MQKLELYIEGNRIDLFKDETVSITQTIQNVKDISKIFTSFTKTFSLPASKVNNKIFKHFYNFDIVDGFDARLKKPAEILLNSVPFKTGRVKLEGVDLKNNVAYIYRITFFGNTVELPDVIGEDKLGALPFSGTDYELTYSPDEIKEFLSKNKTSTGTGVNENIIVPLITHTQRLYYDSVTHINGDGNLFYHTGGGGSSTNMHGVYWNQLKYAIRLYAIIEQIEERYSAANGYEFPIQFSRDFFNVNNPEFYNLYMWLHRKSGSVEPATQVTSYTSPITGWSIVNPVAVVPSGQGFYIPSFYVNQPNGITQWEVEFTTANTTDPYRLVISLNGTVIYTSPFTVTGSFTFNQNPALVGDGQYVISVQHSEIITFTNIEVRVYGFTQTSGTGNVPYTDTLFLNQGFTVQKQFTFVVSEQIPDVTVMSFLTGLFKAFNLVAYVNDAGTIIVRPLDAKFGTADYSYYTSADIDGNDAPVKYDISQFVDSTKGQVNAALPYKEIIYKYDGLGTYLAKQHEQLSGSGWGTLKYIGGTSSDGTGGQNYNASTKVYKVSVPFEHMKFERLIDAANSNLTTVQWGYSVNESQQAYIGLPLIFYAEFIPVDIGTNTRISFMESDSLKFRLDSYYVPSNSLYLNTGNGTENINFNLELNEWTGGSGFDETLFNNFHSEYIIAVFNESRRITKVDAYLPLRILYNFKLNDIFSINQKDYIINSITTNLQSGKSKLELLNRVYKGGQGGNPPGPGLQPPSNLRVTGTTQDSISVAWDLPLGQIDNIGIDLNQSQYATVSSTTTTYTFSNLQGQQTYRIGVYSILQGQNSSVNFIDVPL